MFSHHATGAGRRRGPASGLILLLTVCALALGCGRTKPEDPLLLAIMDSDAEAVRALLDGGVDPNE
ncbi:MAG: hypothetical protein ACYS8K_10130, partial [Planctomycetota bacterium]